MLSDRKLSPAFGYTLRIVAIVFIVEFSIMMFFFLFPIKNIFYEGIIDSVLLIIILSPSLYKFVYLPLLREIKHHLSTQKELEESTLKLKEYSRNLEEMADTKAKELLKMSARDTVILENSNDAVIICDSDMKIVFWNRTAEEIFGYGKEEVIGKDTLLIVPEQYKEGHTEGFRRIIQKGEISYRKLYSVEGVRKDGTLIPVEISMSYYKSNGELLVTAIIRNITERQTSEFQIKHQLDRLAALRSIDMAITASLDLRVTFNVILEQIAATIHADASDILLLNPHTLRLEYAAGRGPHKSASVYPFAHRRRTCREICA
ncbi:MAG: PAS domain S-box protein [Nitrospinae bacterium]|nr:PAS domain S-box protein [Nitrospinota bacterium]